MVANRDLLPSEEMRSYTSLKTQSSGKYSDVKGMKQVTNSVHELNGDLHY
jgi:hypothetical protein